MIGNIGNDLIKKDWNNNGFTNKDYIGKVSFVLERIGLENMDVKDWIGVYLIN